MTTTVNISLPKSMFEDVKKAMVARRYTSVSEIVRDGLRKILYEQDLTENGFTLSFEDEILKSAAEPMEKARVWETEKDIDNYFRNLDRKVKAKKKS